ncbi:hypothetical protein TVAG_411190 [Trichomonas vaginalis G3]|uniref:BRCT domain-containing protein n=1 Tax=Trichomonas vaginalis (strain ATCC PRA-98 / G3) TaxID=412133 RepID=A2DXM4_TRIV3|nr:protein localization to site of double-strand break [Trichomonas vaginalis G3]EAY14853.1 hypothetical protein TVAG_411190 [Trichomonas vaginalis G3]KAI5541166.1 protein localization to site of double-strand break [Trichomonas vaginalis G3]|eukprot:XP_001327076.1 hypothetical protein [Trichomonas vaginalis G3]
MSHNELNKIYNFHNSFKFWRHKNGMSFSRLWISPNIQEKRHSIIKYLSEIYRGIKETTDFSKSSTLHVGSIDDTIKNCSKLITYVSDVAIIDAIDKKIKDVNFIKNNSQIVSLCLYNKTISTSGFSKKDNIKIARMVLLMGGNFSHNICDKTDILISSTVLSQSYFTAHKRDIPIVGVEWIASCFKKLQKLPTEEFRIPYFHNVTFTSTDLQPARKKKLRRKILSYGGSWSDKLDDNTTFLITESLTLTTKISAALSAKIFIISPKWIDDCISSKSPPDNYIINWWQFGFKMNKIFEGKTFTIDRAVTNDNLVEAIKANGGEINTHGEYYICPSSIYGRNFKGILVSNFWIWQCIRRRELIDPEFSQIFKPLLNRSLPVKEFEGKTVFIYKVDSENFPIVIHAVRECGGNVTFKLRPSTSYIISSKVDKVISDQAKQNKIPIVRPEWAIDLLSNGRIPSSEKFNADVTSVIKNICGIIKNCKESSTVQRSSSKAIALEDLEFSEEHNEEETSGPESDGIRLLNAKVHKNFFLSSDSSSEEDDPLLRELGIL